MNRLSNTHNDIDVRRISSNLMQMKPTICSSSMRYINASFAVGHGSVRCPQFFEVTVENEQACFQAEFIICCQSVQSHGF